MKRKIFACLLALAMLLTTASVMGVSAEGTVKQVSNATDLATALKSAATDSSITVELTADIDASAWSTNTNFSGTLNGNGHKITGLTNNKLINGLLGGTVKNLVLDDVNMTVSSAGTSAVLANYANGTVTVENVTVNGSLTLNGLTNTKQQTGVMIGNVGYQCTDNTISFINCVNNVNVTASFAPTSVPDDGYAAVGGFVGAGTGGTVSFTSCINNGNVMVTASTSKTTSVGGFIGNTKGLSDVTFKACTNSGMIDCSIGASANSRAGGFIAYAPNAEVTYNFDHCVNIGSVTADGFSAGFMATSNAKQILIFNASSNMGTIKSTAKDNNSMAAGFVSKIASLTTQVIYTNCYNSGAVSAYRFAGGYVADSRTGDLSFKNSVNAGEISVVDNVNKSTNGFAGGFAAQLYVTTGTNAIVFDGCINSGTITVNTAKKDTQAHAGGFIGIVDKGFKTFANNINVGNVVSGYYAGGFISKYQPHNTSTVFDNCLMNASVTGAENCTGALIGLVNSNNASTFKKTYYYLGEGIAAIGTNNASLTTLATYTLSGYGEADGAGKTYEEVAVAGVADLSSVVPAFELQYQEKEQENAFGVRFLTGLKEDSDKIYSKVGFQVMSVIDGKAPTVAKDPTKFESSAVYSGLLADNATKTAADLFGEGFAYIGMLGVEQIPDNITVTFIVRPYVVEGEGESAVRTYGNAVSYTYVNGVLQA